MALELEGFGLDGTDENVDYGKVLVFIRENRLHQVGKSANKIRKRLEAEGKLKDLEAKEKKEEVEKPNRLGNLFKLYSRTIMLTRGKPNPKESQGDDKKEGDESKTESDAKDADDKKGDKQLSSDRNSPKTSAPPKSDATPQENSPKAVDDKLSETVDDGNKTEEEKAKPIQTMKKIGNIFRFFGRPKPQKSDLSEKSPEENAEESAAEKSEGETSPSVDETAGADKKPSGTAKPTDDPSVENDGSTKANEDARKGKSENEKQPLSDEEKKKKEIASISEKVTEGSASEPSKTDKKESPKDEKISPDIKSRKDSKTNESGKEDSSHDIQKLKEDEQKEDKLPGENMEKEDLDIKVPENIDDLKDMGKKLNSFIGFDDEPSDRKGSHIEEFIPDFGAEQPDSPEVEPEEKPENTKDSGEITVNEERGKKGKEESLNKPEKTAAGKEQPKEDEKSGETLEGSNKKGEDKVGSINRETDDQAKITSEDASHDEINDKSNNKDEADEIGPETLPSDDGSIESKAADGDRTDAQFKDDQKDRDEDKTTSDVPSKNEIIEKGNKAIDGEGKDQSVKDAESDKPSPSDAAGPTTEKATEDLKSQGAKEDYKSASEPKEAKDKRPPAELKDDVSKTSTKDEGDESPEADDSASKEKLGPGGESKKKEKTEDKDSPPDSKITDAGKHLKSPENENRTSDTTGDGTKLGDDKEPVSQTVQQDSQTDDKTATANDNAIDNKAAEKPKYAEKKPQREAGESSNDAQENKGPSSVKRKSLPDKAKAEDNNKTHQVEGKAEEVKKSLQDKGRPDEEKKSPQYKGKAEDAGKTRDTAEEDKEAEEKGQKPKPTAVKPERKGSAVKISGKTTTIGEPKKTEKAKSNERLKVADKAKPKELAKAASSDRIKDTPKVGSAEKLRSNEKLSDLKKNKIPEMPSGRSKSSDKLGISRSSERLGGQSFASKRKSLPGKTDNKEMKTARSRSVSLRPDLKTPGKRLPGDKRNSLQPIGKRTFRGKSAKSENGPSAGPRLDEIEEIALGPADEEHICRLNFHKRHVTGLREVDEVLVLQTQAPYISEEEQEEEEEDEESAANRTQVDGVQSKRGPKSQSNSKATRDITEIDPNKRPIGRQLSSGSNASEEKPPRGGSKLPAGAGNSSTTQKKTRDGTQNRNKTTNVEEELEKHPPVDESLARNEGYRAARRGRSAPRADDYYDDDEVGSSPDEEWFDTKSHASTSDWYDARSHVSSLGGDRQYHEDREDYHADYYYDHRVAAPRPPDRGRKDRNAYADPRLAYVDGNHRDHRPAIRNSRIPVPSRGAVSPRVDEYLNGPWHAKDGPLSRSGSKSPSRRREEEGGTFPRSSSSSLRKRPPMKTVVNKPVIVTPKYFSNISCLRMDKGHADTVKAMRPAHVQSSSLAPPSRITAYLHHYDPNPRSPPDGERGSNRRGEKTPSAESFRLPRLELPASEEKRSGRSPTRFSDRGCSPQPSPTTSRYRSRLVVEDESSSRPRSRLSHNDLQREPEYGHLQLDQRYLCPENVCRSRCNCLSRSADDLVDFSNSSSILKLTFVPPNRKPAWRI